MRWRIIQAAAVASVLPLAAPASAQVLPAALLPATGTTVNVGGLRQQLEGLLPTGGGGSPTVPGWVFTPSVTLEQRWTNQPQAGSGSGSSDSAFITVIRPGLLVNGDTSRVQATLNYMPDVQIGTGGFQDRIDQNLSATGKITFIPDHLFLSLRGFAATQSTSGGYGSGSTVSLDRQDQTQSTSFSATPYLRQQFGDIGSAELGASLSHTSMQSLQDGQSFIAANSTANQMSTTQQEYLSFTSGPQFGRYRGVALASTQQSEGTGVMNGATRQTASLDNGFAVTRDITVLGKFGTESI